MLVGLSVLGVLNLLAVVYCVLDLSTSRKADVRVLPKPLWFLALLLPVVGPAAWWLAGRPRPGSGRAVPKVLPDTTTSRRPDDDEEFLRQLRRRAEEQRRAADEQRRRDEDRPA